MSSHVTATKDDDSTTAPVNTPWQICRAGGEEFLIALTSTTTDIAQMATRSCTAIATQPSHQATASIGTATAKLHQVRGPDSAGSIEELITIADETMYAAKRNGGNQAQHA